MNRSDENLGTAARDLASFVYMEGVDAYKAWFYQAAGMPKLTHELIKDVITFPALGSAAIMIQLGLRSPFSMIKHAPNFAINLHNESDSHQPFIRAVGRNTIDGTVDLCLVVVGSLLALPITQGLFIAEVGKILDICLEKNQPKFAAEIRILRERAQDLSATGNYIGSVLSNSVANDIQGYEIEYQIVKLVTHGLHRISGGVDYIKERIFDSLFNDDRYYPKIELQPLQPLSHDLYQRWLAQDEFSLMSLLKFQPVEFNHNPNTTPAKLPASKPLLSLRNPMPVFDTGSISATNDKKKESRLISGVGLSVQKNEHTGKTDWFSYLSTADPMVGAAMMAIYFFVETDMAKNIKKSLDYQWKVLLADSKTKNDLSLSLSLEKLKSALAGEWSTWNIERCWRDRSEHLARKKEDVVSCLHDSKKHFRGDPEHQFALEVYAFALQNMEPDKFFEANDAVVTRKDSTKIMLPYKEFCSQIQTNIDMHGLNSSESKKLMRDWCNRFPHDPAGHVLYAQANADNFKMTQSAMKNAIHSSNTQEKLNMKKHQMGLYWKNYLADKTKIEWREELIKLCQQQLNNQDIGDQAKEYLVEIYADKKDYQSAKQLQKQMCVHGSQCHSAWRQLGLLYLEKDLTDAIECFNRCLSINPKDYEAAIGVATAHYSSGSYEEALLICQTVKQQDERVILISGWCHLQMNDLSNAKECLHRCMELNPESLAVKQFNECIQKITRQQSYQCVINVSLHVLEAGYQSYLNHQLLGKVYELQDTIRNRQFYFPVSRAPSLSQTISFAGSRNSFLETFTGPLVNDSRRFDEPSNSQSVQTILLTPRE